MRLARGPGQDISHSGIGRIDERFLLFASTLTRFPAGLRPFPDIEGRLRIAVLDSSSRGLLMRLPLVFRGLISDRMRALGYHLLGGDRFDLDIGDRFILDGEAFPAGRYRLSLGPTLRFVVP